MKFKSSILALASSLVIVIAAGFSLPSSVNAASLSGPVALDAGHGGNDSGAIGNGLVEKELTWKIANYCKERLTQLGIPTVMVRTSQDENPSIYTRAARANDAGARCLISFHINSATSSSACGAELLVGNESSYNYWSTTEGKTFAANLLPKFANLGISNRGILQRDYGGGDTESYYPDGSMADYYGIVRYARRFNMTGNIIEHGFLSNASDASIMKNENNLRQMAYYDAESIAAVWPNQGQWIKNNVGWWYQKTDGTYPANCWYMIGHTWYAFNEAGYMRSGWFNDGGVWYYLGDENDGSMHTGWLHLAEGWYYLDTSGRMSTGWVSTSDATYYFKSSGLMATGLTTIDGKNYYFDVNGRLQKGWVLINDTWYYFDSDGSMHKGWLHLAEGWYFLDTSGKMCTGWVHTADATYYFKPSGLMAVGWDKIANTWYYFDVNGKLQKNWLLSGSTWYYLDPSNGAMHTGWLNLNGKWYFLNINNSSLPEGAMYAGPKTWNINGTSYYVEASGYVRIAYNTWTNTDGCAADKSDPSTRAYYYDGDGQLVYVLNSHTAVMGTSTTTKNAFVSSFARRIATNYPQIYRNNASYGAQTPEAFAELTWQAASDEGVRPEFLAAQIGDETGWLRFGGAVPASACNFGGIGAVDSSPDKYAVFPDIYTGLLAQAQHIKAYSSNLPCSKPCVDPRWSLVKRNSAPYIEYYGWGMWASNPTYGMDLLRLTNEILAG